MTIQTYQALFNIVAAAAIQAGGISRAVGADTKLATDLGVVNEKLIALGVALENNPELHAHGVKLSSEILNQVSEVGQLSFYIWKNYIPH